MRIRDQQKRQPPWQRLGDHDGFVIRDVNYRTQRSDPTGQLLREVSHPTVTAFWDHAAWEEIRNEPGFEHHPGLHDPNRPDIRGLAGVQFISDIPPRQLMRMHFLESLVIDLERRHRAGQTKLVRDEVQSLIDGEMGEVARKKLKERQLGPGAKGGREYKGIDDITGSALLKKRRDYLRGGFAALRDGRYRSSNAGANIQPEVAALIALHLAINVSNPSATARSILDDIQDDIEVQNERAVLAGLAAQNEEALRNVEILRVPDIKTVRRAKGAMDPFQADIGKYGLDAAVQMNPAVRGKPDRLGPLDRVEYDESIVDAITLLTESGAWNLLTDEEKKRVKKARMVIGVAICVATRCIVAMRIYKTGNADETVATFRMILEDKTRYVPPNLRDKLSWHQHGGIGTVVLDQGSSNISDAARTVLANLNVPILVAEAGRPDQRGTGERIFRTFGSEIYSYLDARTGSDVVDRRNYKPEGRASLALDELWKVLVIGVVGIYHNTPHRELGGRTPAYEWERLAPDYGVNALPDPNRRRVTFGRHRKRIVTRYGVDFAGLSYTNPLVDHHYLHGTGPIEVAGDSEDLSAVSVKFGTSWYEAPCTDPDIGHTRLEDWYAACAAQKDLASDDARKRRAARRAAKQAIRAIQENARDRANMPPQIITDAMIEHGERRIFGKYQHAAEDQPVDNGQLGIDVEPDNHEPSATNADAASVDSPAQPATAAPAVRPKKKPASKLRMTR
jgi:putative transposase